MSPDINEILVARWRSKLEFDVEAAIEPLRRLMVQMHALHARPRVTVKDGKVEITHNWDSPEAERHFNDYKKLADQTVEMVVRNSPPPPGYRVPPEGHPFAHVLERREPDCGPKTMAAERDQYT